MMALLEENNWEKHLENLLSYEEYKKLDDVNIKDYSGNYCVKELGSVNEEDKTLCKKISLNLTKLSTLQVDELKSGCYYFQHWFYDNIAKKYYNGNKRGDNYRVAEKLFDIISLFISKYSKLEPCRCYESGSPDDWKKEKYLHDFFKNHEDIKCNDSDKCEKYVKYVTYIDKLFQSKENNCCSGDELDNVHCEPYINCKYKTRPDALLTKLEKELKELDKKGKEVPKAGVGGDASGEAAQIKAAGSGVAENRKAGHGAVRTGSAGNKGAEAGNTGSKTVGSEEKGPENTGAEVAKPAATVPGGGTPEAVKLAAANSVPAKPATPKLTQLPPPEPNEAVDEEQVLEVGVDVEQPEEIVDEDELSEEEAPETLEGETTVTLEDTSTFSHQSIEDSGATIHVGQYYTSGLASNIVPRTNSEVPSILGITHEELDSNFFRNVIMAVAVLGTIFFLFYYNRSSRLEPSSRKRKQKKYIFERNYYEEYENELTMHASEETLLDSETGRLYLNYHPDQDSYY